MTMGLRHDVPHFAVFHSRNESGVCPICLAASAESWVELTEKLREGLRIAESEVQRETEQKFKALVV